MRLYVASSWRNAHQPAVVVALRQAGHDVYDFRQPLPENTGFSWGNLAADWQGWSPAQFIAALGTDTAAKGFASDLEAMRRAAGCVLVLPCGRSAHLEAGWFMGVGRPVFILVPPDYGEPELMYLLGGRDRLFTSTADLLAGIAGTRE